MNILILITEYLGPALNFVPKASALLVLPYLRPWWLSEGDYPATEAVKDTPEEEAGSRSRSPQDGKKEEVAEVGSGWLAGCEPAKTLRSGNVWGRQQNQLG